MRRRLVTARLITVINLLNKSAALAYRRETGLLDFDWRVLATVGWRAPLSFTELATMLSQDKGQISRSVKRLVGAGQLSHPHARAKIALTRAGMLSCERVYEMFIERNVVLIRGIATQELTIVWTLLPKVLENARSLVTEELSRVTGEPEPPDRHDVGAGTTLFDDEPPWTPRHDRRFAQLMTPLLANVVGTMRKSAAMTFKRELGLSDFGWRVMSQIGEHSPVELSRLVGIMSRDKSQIGRSVTRLERAGYVTRQRMPGTRNIVLVTTEAGRTLYARLAKLSLRRDQTLRRDLSGEEQDVLLDVLDKLATNADALYQREQALNRGASAPTEVFHAAP